MSVHGITIDETGRHVRTSDGRFNRQPDPTPGEIAAGCESIRESWSDRERAKRAAAPVAWTVPVVGVNLEGDT